VRAGQPLFDIYSPELVAAQEEALLALRTAGADSSLARSAVRKLELWDLSPAEIERLTAEGVARRAVTVRAPRSGYVLHHRVEHGARVEAGEDLYRLGDLDTIWVTAQVYEIDAPWVEAGQPARVEPSYGAGEPVLGEVSTVYPTVDPHTRTLTVRVVLDNPELRLKPGMFATVHLEHRRIDDVLAVPTEAVLHSGRRELVFVALGDGHFEPREVTTGLVGDGHLTEVRSGLTEGEVVVVSGQFLLDSETKLQEALRTLLAARAQADHGRPAAPPAPDPRPATPSHTDHAHVDHPVAQPGQYTCPMNPKIVSDEPGRCPVCGMFLEQVPDAEEPTPGHVP